MGVAVPQKKHVSASLQRAPAYGQTPYSSQEQKLNR